MWPKSVHVNDVITLILNFYITTSKNTPDKGHIRNKRQDVYAIIFCFG